MFTREKHLEEGRDITDRIRFVLGYNDHIVIDSFWAAPTTSFTFSPAYLSSCAS
jgi:hypothetical protein